MGTFAPDALSIHLPLLKAPVAGVMAAEERGWWCLQRLCHRR